MNLPTEMYKLVPLDYSSFPWLEIFCVWKPQFIIIVKSSAWVWIVSEGLRHATRSICFNCFLKTNILNKLWFFSIFNHFLCCSFRSQSLSVILLQVPLRHMKKVSRLIHFCFIFSLAPKSFKESRGCQYMLPAYVKKEQDVYTVIYVLCSTVPFNICNIDMIWGFLRRAFDVCLTNLTFIAITVLGFLSLHRKCESWIKLLNTQTNKWTNETLSVINVPEWK